MRIAGRWAVAAALILTTIASTPLASAAPGDPGDVPIAGPDVSNWNHPNGACIDWQKVAAGDTATRTPPRGFAFIKATEGTTYTNPYLKSCGGHLTQGDWSATRAAGMAHAAYHFARPSLPLSDAVDEAQFFVSVIGDQLQQGTLAPVLIGTFGRLLNGTWLISTPGSTPAVQLPAGMIVSVSC